MTKKLITRLFKPLAHRAVESAEENFGAGKGIAKKRFAMNFVLARLPLAEPFRIILGDFLIDVIDLAIESAVQKIR